MKFQPIIGLETHIQLNTASKMFCGCDANIWRAEPNTHVCPVCLGLPGALPVINKAAVEKAILAGLTFNCKINKFTKWDRKNYFYPDLPKGYQISQYDLPLCVHGELKIKEQKEKSKDTNKNSKTIRIRRVHLEEDTAKSIHRSDATLLDFNKSGIPLLEIVTEPDITSANEAIEFGKKVKEILRAIGVTEGNMERGQMRFEVNVSLRPDRGNPCQGVTPQRHPQLPSYKVEVKNINSFRFLKKATEYEIKRQTELLEHGETPVQETRGFDETKNITFTQRIKEEAQDYRYFPEPDLPPLRFTDADIEKIKVKIPKLPQILVPEIISKFGITQKQAQILAKKKTALDYVNILVQEGIEPKRAVNIVINQPEVLQTKPEALVKKLQQEKENRVGDREELGKIITGVLRDNPTAAADYKSGKTEVLKFLLGQVMRKTTGRADPQIAKEILENLLQQKKPTLDK